MEDDLKSTVKVECSGCNQIIDMDVNHLGSFCPYCGVEILLDTNNINKLIELKEKTDEERKTKEKTSRKVFKGILSTLFSEKYRKFTIIALIVLAIIILSALEDFNDFIISLFDRL